MLRRSHSDWPQGAIKRLREAVNGLNNVATRMKDLGRKSPTITIAVSTTVVTKLLQGDISDLTPDQELVLEALRRSRNDLNDASEVKLIEYVAPLSDCQLDGLINNVKGIYQELLFGIGVELRAATSPVSPLGMRFWIACDVGVGGNILDQFVHGKQTVAALVERFHFLAKIKIMDAATLDMEYVPVIGVGDPQRVADLPGGGPRTIRRPTGVHGV